MNSLLYILFILNTLLFTHPKQNGTIIIDIENLKNSKGKVNLSLYNSKDGFPSDPGKAYKIAASTIKDGKAQFIFHGIPAGQYAIAVLHDENNNNKMDITFYGKPKEGFGFSNNAKKMFGPPDFDDAKFDLYKQEMKLQINIYNY